MATSEQKLKDFPADFKLTLEGVPTAEIPNGVVVTLPEIRQMTTVVNMLEDFGTTDVIPIQGGLDNNAIANIINYLRQVEQTPLPEKKDTQNNLRVEEQPWEKNFFNQLFFSNKKFLFDFLLAANFLDIQPAVQAAALHIANTISGKTPDEIRSTFLVA